mgnify:FL=1
MAGIFLEEQRLWSAKGTYIDDKGRKIKATGETEVLFKRGKITIESTMRLPVKANKMLELKNVYHVKPVKKGRHETEWESKNPTSGNFKGKFLIAGTYIVSTYISTDNKYTGFETFEFRQDGSYMNKGCLFFGDNKVSEWEMVLS